MPKTCVIFDLDGTLIESEQIWRDVRREFVEQHGGAWHDGAQENMIGMRTAEWSRYIHDDLRVAMDPPEIAKRVVDAVVERISKNVPMLPGADAALEGLARSFRLGLATSATEIVAKTVLHETRWDALFEAVVSADAVERGKPAPDVYLRALEKMNADGRVTAGIEDSGNGIRSAHAAGLAVAAIPNREFPPEAGALSLACRVLPDLYVLNAETIKDMLSARILRASRT